MKRIFILFCLLALSIASMPQEFSLVPTGFPGVGNSSVAWGDYDSDGDLDALITGDPVSGQYTAAVYRNNSGEFFNINAALTGIYNSAVAWGDYDGDGDLDILATGSNSTNSKTFIYQNIDGSFVQKEPGLPEIGSDGAIAWGDYDGDGDLDILVAGNFTCKVFNNAAGSFTDIHSGLPDVSNCWVDWGDFDNDGDLDIFVMGDLGGILISSIWKNNGGVFTEAPQTGILPLAGGSASWCDYDMDHDLDILIQGFDEYLNPNTAIFENLGDLQFLQLNTSLIGTALGSVAWGDYDNDGDADILLTGKNGGCGINSSKVYRNEGNGVFNDANAILNGTERGSAAWGDYDNDGDLDILISGFSVSGSPLTRLYSNTLGSNTYTPNQPPDTPQGLSVNINGHAAELSWLPSSDDQTPGAGISYNLRIGKTSQGHEVLPAMADHTTGKRLLPMNGNTGNNTSWVVNLPDGNYYWSVQAMDHTFAASGFSPEHFFTILNVGLRDEFTSGFKVFPNPVTDLLLISNNSSFTCKITGPDGRIIRDDISESGSLTISTQGWKPGIYLVKVSNKGRDQVYKVIKG